MFVSVFGRLVLIGIGGVLAGDSSDSKTKLPFFTAYDFFGYLIPGAILVFIAAIIEQVFISRYEFRRTALEHVYCGCKLENVISEINQPRPVFSSVFVEFSLLDKPTNWITSLPIVLGVFVLIYVAGHVVSTISSFLLDRVFIRQAIGYPFEHCLYSKSERYHSRRTSVAKYFKGLVAWFNILFVCLYFEFIFGGCILPCLVLSSCAALIIATFLLWYEWVASEWVTRFRVTDRAIGDCCSGRANPLCAVILYVAMCATWFARVGLILFSLPFDLCTKIIWLCTAGGSVDAYFSDDFRKMFENKFREVYPSLDYEKEQSNVYWLTAMHVEMESPVLYANIKNWHNIYGFARNLSTSFFLLFVYVVFYIHQYNLGELVKLTSLRWLLPLGLLFLAHLMLVRFLYIYFLYYSKNLFRAFVCCGSSSQSER